MVLDRSDGGFDGGEIGQWGLLGKGPETIVTARSRQSWSSVDAVDFDTALHDLAAILGDPTRRGIYLTMRESPEPSTASTIAASFGIHPNVARHHLDLLVEEGYAEVTAPPNAVQGAGRPARHYRTIDRDIAVSYPPRRFDLLSDLLVKVIEKLDPVGAPAIAEEVGFGFGTQLALETGVAGVAGVAGGHDAGTAMLAVTAALETIGFGVASDTSDHSLLTNHCPFGRTAAEHPEIICKIDQGIVRGLMEAARGEQGPVVMSPHAGPDESCVTGV
jgi:predicted ArsR family transcriptional regulator